MSEATTTPRRRVTSSRSSPPRACIGSVDPEPHLRDLFRVLAHWLKDRYLELAPKYWAATRARLVPKQLDAEIGDLTVPPPPPSEGQPASS